MKVKLLEPKLQRSPFSFFFRFFVGTKKLKLKSTKIDQNFEFELRQAFTQYCAAIKIVPETCYYEITTKPTLSDINRWSYLKGVINLDNTGYTVFETPFPYEGKVCSIKVKNKKNQIIIVEENLNTKPKGKNIYFNLFFHKNPKHKKGKLLIDLTSGN
tara:strand:+ start:5067 stop:5540 length:474 start_codon:yes stop_codon:yes gene_type:complete